MNMSFAIRTFGLGFVAGLRSLTAPAVALASTGSPLALPVSVLAAGELIADKLPITPSRLEPPGLGIRICSGAYCAFVLGALTGAWAGYNIRKKLDDSTPVPDILLGMTEDALAISLAFLLAQRDEAPTQPDGAGESATRSAL